MKTARSGLGRLAALGLALALIAPGLHAQSTTMPSTLRYGSGLLDVPVATVLPHLAVTGTFSGFFANTDRELQLDGTFGSGVDKFYQDASVTDASPSSSPRARVSASPWAGGTSPPPASPAATTSPAASASRTSASSRPPPAMRR